MPQKTYCLRNLFQGHGNTSSACSRGLWLTAANAFYRRPCKALRMNFETSCCPLFNFPHVTTITEKCQLFFMTAPHILNSSAHALRKVASSPGGGAKRPPPCFVALERNTFAQSDGIVGLVFLLPLRANSHHIFHSSPAHLPHTVNQRHKFLLPRQIQETLTCGEIRGKNTIHALFFHLFIKH